MDDTMDITPAANASPDEEAVKSLVGEIRDQLNQQDMDAVRNSVQKLGTESNPNFTVNLLAPQLLLANEQKFLTSDEALSIITLLASSNAALYLKPASRAVKSAAENIASTTSSGRSMAVSKDVLSVLVAQLSGDDVEVSSNAAATVTTCCRRLGPPLADQAIRAISDSWRAAWGKTASDRTRSSTICVRCASAVVDIATLGDASMESAISCGATDLLLAMVTDESDPLLQMSSLDLVERLAKTLPMHGSRARWLFSRGVIHPLIQMAGGSNPDENPDPILGGPALRLLSSLCQLGQRDASLFGLGGEELLHGFHTALQKFDGSSELDRLSLIDAVSSFASASPDALEVVLNDPVLLETWLSFANVSQAKLKSAVCTSLAHVLDPPAVVDANGDSVVPANIPTNAMSMKLLSALGQVNGRDSTELVLSLAKSPLPELRLGAYALLEAVAKRGTGSQVLLSHGGFLEFLVNREGETTKEGKEAKFAVVQAVMQSDAAGLLADSVVSALEKIVKQGPHYVQTQAMDVMTE